MLYAPFFNYGYGDLSMTYEATLHPRTRHGPVRRRRPLRRDLRRRHAHVHAHPLGPRPHAGGRRSRSSTSCTARPARPPSSTACTTAAWSRPGMRADLNLIDFDALSLRPARAWRSTCPAGGRRLVQRATGYVATFVAGVQTVADDEFTGALPGRLVRGPQPSG